MPSTFFGLNIASSAMSAFQVAVNTTANNVSNVQTEGYSKQVATRRATDGLRVYQKFGMAGSGVTTDSITSLRSAYYDTKYWNNQASVGNYDTKVAYLNQIENYFIDDGAERPGFATIFANMFNQMNALSSDAGDIERRKDFISEAQSFASYFHDVANGLQDLQKDCNEEIYSLIERLNSSTQKIASLTKQINTIELTGYNANELRDQRALIIDQISEICPITVEESPITNSNYPDMYLGGTNYLVKLDGQTLVNNYNYKTLTCVPREHKVNQTDADGLYDVIWSDTGMKFNINAKSMNGSLRSLLDIRDGNHAENLKGQVVSATNGFIKIKPDTMTSVESMTMAAEGVITIRNKEYYYSGFTAELDENGKVISYTFEMEKSMDTSVAASVIGRKAEIGASVDAMGIPYYMAQMSEFLRCFSGRFNAYQKGAMDLNEEEMGAFFVATGFDGTEYSFNEQSVDRDGVTAQNSVISSSSDCYYQLTAFSFNVADASIRDSSKFATSMDIIGGNVDAHDVIDEMLKLQDKVKLFRGGSAADFLNCIYTDISVETNEAILFQKNYNDIASAITNQRLSISGVDEDEEALDIVKFQNAYNLAARMIQCMSEMYDKLIQGTGV